MEEKATVNIGRFIKTNKRFPTSEELLDMVLDNKEGLTKEEKQKIDKNAGYYQILLKKGDIKMKNGTRNEKVVFDIIFNLICMIYIIYSWMSITNVGVVTALTHNNGDAMLLIFGSAIVLIVFFIIDIISLILGKNQKGYLLPGYVGVSIGVKCIAILFLVLAYILKLKI